MKKSHLFAAAALIALSTGTAKAHHWIEEVSVSTTWAYESSYIFRGVQFAENSFQPDLSISVGNFYVGAWANLPIGDDNVAFGDELDLYAGYSFALSELVSADVGVTYYTFPDAQSGFFDTFDEDDGTGANTLEPFLSLAFDSTLSPSVSMYYDFMFETFTLEGGIGHSFPVAEKLSLDLALSAGHVFDDDDGADYSYGSVSADLAYAFTESFSTAVGVRYGVSSEDTFFDDFSDIQNLTFDNDGFWVGLSVSAGF